MLGVCVFLELLAEFAILPTLFLCWPVVWCDVLVSVVLSLGYQSVRGVGSQWRLAGDLERP